jgi:membrane protein
MRAPTPADIRQPHRADASDEHHRGREADHPIDIPERGWCDIAARVRGDLAEHQIAVIAGGVAFFCLLAATSALGGLVALYSLVADPGELPQRTHPLAAVLPHSVMDLIVQHLRALARTSQGALGAGVAGGLVLAAWSAVRAMRTLMAAVNVAYRECETRPLLARTATAAALAGATVMFLVLGLALFSSVPDLLPLPRGSAWYWAGVGLRWALLIGVQLVALAVLYRYAPNRARARWRWTSPGALLGAVLIVLAWAAFALFANVFERAIQSALGTMTAVMTWAYASAYAVLLGAEANAEAERQTLRDTTEGSPRPLGQRRAQAANTVGKAADA